MNLTVTAKETAQSAIQNNPAIIKDMKFRIFLQDLNDEWISRIKDVLAYDLADEIEDAVESGISRDTAEAEAIDYYLNTHNWGWEIEI